MRWTGLVFLLCTGCATPLPPPAAVTEFVEEAVRLYEIRELRAVQITARGPWAASAGRDQIFLHRTWAMSPMTDAIMAHEVAHFVLGHDRENRDRPASDIIRDELDANAKAVEILVRVRRRSERDAVAAMKDVLILAAQRRQHPKGHALPCDELADLARRFPQYDVRSSVCP